MSYRGKYDVIKKLKPRQRGFAFEKLINEIFDDCGVLIKPSYKTADQSQQIDGAIEINSRVFLLEAKWEKNETLAASKLYSFIGKINSKLEGTLGVFISHNRLKENFVNAVRDGLRQNCILIHGKENIREIVDGNLNLKDYIIYCYREASTKNVVEVSASEFISLAPKIVNSKNVSGIIESIWPTIYEHLKDSSSYKNFIDFLQKIDDLGIDIPKKLVSVLPHLSLSFTQDQKLNFLRERIIDEAKNLYEEAVKNKLVGDYWRKYASEEVVSIITKDIKFEQPVYSRIIKNVTSGFNGDWEIENDASRILESMFSDLNLDNKILIAKKYLQIYLDNYRLSKFKQKQFANSVFLKLKEGDKELYELFFDEIIEDLKNQKKIDIIWIEQGIGSEESIKKDVINRILTKYDKLIKRDKRDEIKSQLSKIYDSL